MSSTPPRPEEQAIEIIASRQFHQVFTLPATDDHGALRLTYSIAGPELGEDVPTILFCGAMFGTRWQAVGIDWLARKERVRIIFIDRPGFGGSTPVPLVDRISTFLTVIPSLLIHLKIPHIHLASHSAGTLYALNLLSLHPEILSPTHPTIHLFAPWVHQSHSKVTMLTAASMLPDSMLSYWDSLIGFAINKGVPGFRASSGFLNGISSGLFSGKVTEGKAEEEERVCKEVSGVGLKVRAEIEKLAFKCAFEEETKGANEEARFCLKSVGGVSWGEAEDYQVLVAKLNGVWEEKVRRGGERLQVRIFLGEEDVMVGDRGMKYFEDCWSQEKCGAGIDVQCQRVEGTDHDSVIDPLKRVMEKMFANVKQSLH